MAEQTLKEKTAKGLFWGGLSNGGQQVLNLLFGIVLARILNANDYGLVAMLSVFTGIATTIQDSGFTTALVNKRNAEHQDYNAVFWFSFLSGGIIYVVLFFCAPLIAVFYGHEELNLLSRIVFLSIPISGVGIAFNAFLLKNLLVKERAKIDILSLLSSGIIGVVLAFNGFAYLGIAIQTLVYVGVGTFLKYLYSPWTPKLNINFNPLKSMFSFSFKLFITNVVIQINNNVLSVVLGKFYTANLLGFYSQGQKWTIMGSQTISAMLNGVAQPIFVNVLEEKERQLNILHKFIRFGAFISFPAMLGLAFVAKELIIISVGEKWLQSVPFLQLLCIWGAISYLWSLYTNLLMAHGKSDLYLYGMLFTGALQIAIIVIMSYWGIYAMIVGYITSCFVSLLLWHKFVHNLIGITLLDVAKNISPYFLLTAISILVSYLLLLNVANLYLLIILKIIIVALNYMFLLWIFGSNVFNEFIHFFIDRR